MIKAVLQYLKKTPLGVRALSIWNSWGLLYLWKVPTSPSWSEDGVSEDHPADPQSTSLMVDHEQSDLSELKRFVSTPGVDQARVEFILEELRNEIGREESRNDKIEAKAHSLVAWFTIILTLSIQGSTLLRGSPFLAFVGVLIVFCILFAILFALRATRVTAYLLPKPLRHTLWQDHKLMSQKGYRAFELVTVVHGLKNVANTKATYVDFAQSWVRNGVILIAFLAGIILLFPGSLTTNLSSTPTATMPPIVSSTPTATLTLVPTATQTISPSPTLSATATSVPTATPQATP